VIAAAAARAGLTFVVFTDHGDATRAPDAPVYRRGVLCLDAVEISTTGGHYIALDMPAAPYPLAGEPRDVVEDVHRLGGFGIVAHPDSPKEQLRWKDFTVPFDGIESLNLDTGWRRAVEQAGSGTDRWSRWAAAGRLLAALVDYPFRPAEVIASLTGRSRAPGVSGADGTIERTLDLEMQRRRIVTTAGADAHAKLAFRGDPGESMFSIPIPGYEQTFRTLSVHASLDQPFTSDAMRDSRILIHAIRAGHLYSALDGIATPAAFLFTATNRSGTAHEGDELHVDGPVTLHVRSNAPAEFTTTVWNGAAAIGAGHHESEFTVSVPADPAAYWVGIRAAVGRRDTPWLRSNPIFVRGPGPRLEPPSTAPLAVGRPIFDGTTTTGWHIEHDPTSLGALEIVTGSDGPELRLRYGLSAGMAGAPFVGLVYDVPQGTQGNRLAFTMRAQQPMRISVQVRGAGPRGVEERWQRSVYVSPIDEDRTVDFSDLTPVEKTGAPRPDISAIRSILFVVDTTNTKPGASGRLWIKRAAVVANALSTSGR
jgi:hypothetical protein